MAAHDLHNGALGDAHRPILEELPAMIWRAGPDCGCEYSNRAWLNFTGRTFEQELGYGWTEGVHPADLKRCITVYEAAFRSRKPFQIEYRLRRNDGEYRWVLDTGSPLRDKSGRLTGYVGQCFDITDLKLAQAFVQRHETLSEYARDALLLLGPKGEILEANRAAEKMYGYTRQELLLMTIRELRAPEALATIETDIERAWTEGTLFETLHRAKDGRTFAVEVSSQAATLDDRAVLVSVIREVTDRQAIERQLQASETQYRSLFENTREGVAIHELAYGADGCAVDYVILDVNPAFCMHTGITRGSVVGKLASVAYGTGVAPYFETYSDVVTTGQARSFETYFPPLDRHFSVSAFALAGSRFATVFSDITERKRMDEQLRNAGKMEAVGRLAGGIAHDFNNLLMIMLAHTEFALEELGADSPVRAHLDSILSAAQRASGLTAQLLTFSRKQVVQSQVIDLNDVVGETGDMLKRILGEDIQLDIVRGHGLKRVRADAGQVAQALLNLVVNARDAMPQGGRLVIETSSGRLDNSGRGSNGSRPATHVVLSVKDTGVGMTPDVQSHLFEPFFTTKPKGKGTGLGLSMVYGIVKQCGGEIRVRTRPGTGTTFRIYLPAIDQFGTSRAGTEGGQSSRGSETILFIEDDPDVRRVTMHLLQGLGYDAVAAESGEHAMRLLSDRRFDLVITDVIMPGMSGPELAERVRSVHPGTPVLFISGYPDMPAVGDNAISDDALLQKPFTADALGRKIRQMLQRVNAELVPRPA